MFGHSGHVCPGLCHTLNSNILRMNSSVSFFIVVEGPEQPVSWVKWILSYPSGHTWFPSPRTNQRFTFLPYSKISSCKIVQRTLSRKHCRHCIIRVQSNHTRSRIFRRLKNTMNKRATQHSIAFNNQFHTLEILSRLSQFNPPSSFVGVPLGVILVGVVTICGDTNGDKSTSVRDERLLFRLLLLGLCWRWPPIDTFGSFLIIWSLGISCFFVFWMEELSLTWL